MLYPVLGESISHSDESSLTLPTTQGPVEAHHRGVFLGVRIGDFRRVAQKRGAIPEGGVDPQTEGLAWGALLIASRLPYSRHLQRRA